MNVLKYILLFFIHSFAFSICFSQSANIDSLQNVLQSLEDSSRIDCLNSMSHAYILAEKKDSAEYFANLANEEAKNRGYIHGIAVSLTRKSQIAKHFDDDFIKSELLGKESLRWYEMTGNKAGLYSLLEYIIYSVFSQSRFEEAIFYVKKIYALATQTKDQSHLIGALTWMFAIYRQSGDYERSFEYARQRYELAEKTKNKIETIMALYGMAQLYMLIEDYQGALTYFQRVRQMEDEEVRNRLVISDNDIWFKMELAEVFSHLNQFDSASYYYNLFKPSKDKEVYLRVWWVSTGECYFLQKDYQHALQNFQLGLAEHKKLHDRNEVMRALLDIGKTYVALNNNPEALKYGREGLTIALQTKAKQFIRDGYHILSTVYDRLHQTDSANYYFRLYTTVKDEVLNDLAKAKFAAYNYDQKIALINKEKEIQQATLEKELYMKKVLLAGIFLLLLFGLILIRNIILKRSNEKQQMEHKLKIQKLESERTQAELQQQASELEMQALRAQMNPHFIFNSLNSINRFILQNKQARASEYLTKFSRLVRLILQNSQSALIPLESELESLQLYLELEAVRFDHHFEFKINLENNLDVSALKVPPLIIQPYAENAIWHGLMHKEEKGHLEIELYQQENVLCCRITDDGIGRKKAAELKSKSGPAHKSMGMKITASRIEMLQQKKQLDKHIKITDLVLADGNAGGTEVLLKIPVCYD